MNLALKGHKGDFLLNPYNLLYGAPKPVVSSHVWGLGGTAVVFLGSPGSL